MVDAYGQAMPLNQVATISVPEPRLISVQVWDKSLVQAVTKAIQSSELGLNPATEGQLIRVTIPELTEERRRELTKVAAKYAEQHRVAVRNVRRDGMEKLKVSERNSEISKDRHYELGEEVQQLTDSMIASIDEMLAAKEQEIMQV